ncbi:MAG TPA: glycosyltransferase family 2 protein [archaeon]|nr:glycosyltransferase family 2 protein [archaeon]
MQISVLIPVYKDLQRTATIIKKLNGEEFKGEFEIVVAADCIPETQVTFLETLGAKVDFSTNRRGKVNALNHAFDMVRGELIIFLDSDSEPVSEGFLSKIWESYQNHKFDVATGKLRVDCRKKIHKVMDIDYMFVNAAFSLAEFFNEVSSFCGAFFIIRRIAFEKLGRFSRVLAEDFELSVKANRYNMKYKFIPDVEVITSAPNNFREWIKQRKRWLLGGFKSMDAENTKHALKKFPFSFTSFVTAYPFPITSVIWTFLVFFGAPHISIFSILALSALTTSGAIFLFNRWLDWGVSATSTLNYLTWYGPVWSLMMISIFFTSFFIKEEAEDWVY